MTRRGVKGYFGANLVAQVSALIRFMLLARLLGAEQLGLASMLILTSQFFQAISDTGSDRFLVQDDQGDSPVMQGFVQMVLAMRGVLIAASLVLFGGLVADLYHEPRLASALAWLGLSPLIGGFVHLDFRRVQRHGDFRPETLGIGISELFCLVGTVGAALITHDHTAVIYGLVLRSLALVVISFITSKRPYRWAWARAEGLRFSQFAAPLFLNGLLLFFGGQGDRLLVGRNLGAAALGHYSAILLLIYYPTGTLIRFLASVSLPQLARNRGDPDRYDAAVDRFGGQTMLMALAVAVGFAVVAPVATPILYGKSFAQPLQIFALIGVLQSSRFLRVWPTTVANSIGRSTVILANNVARMVAVPLAFAANWLFHSLEAIVIAFIIGEAVAIVVALWLLSLSKAMPLAREVTRSTAFLAGCAAAAAAAWALQEKVYTVLPVAAIVGLATLAFLLRSERPVLFQASQMVRRRLARLRSA